MRGWAIVLRGGSWNRNPLNLRTTYRSNYAPDLRFNDSPPASMMLRLAPHLVKDYARADEVGFGFGFEPAYRGWTTKDRTVTGHIGSPRAATAEKGEHLFATFAAGVEQLLADVIAWDGKSWDVT